MQFWDVLYIKGLGEDATAHVITVSAETCAGATAAGQTVCDGLCSVLGGGPRLVVDVGPSGSLCHKAGLSAQEAGF